MRFFYRSLFVLAACASLCSAADLSGNWVASQDMHDGTFRKTYFNLKQDGSKISGSIRATQFFYRIVESTGGPDGFTVTASMMDGRSERRVEYQGKLLGDDLQVATRRNPESPWIE